MFLCPRWTTRIVLFDTFYLCVCVRDEITRILGGAVCDVKGQTGRVDGISTDLFTTR